MKGRRYRFLRAVVIALAGLIGAVVGLVAGIFGAVLVANLFNQFSDPGPDNEGGLMLVLSFPGMLVGAVVGCWVAVRLAAHLLPEPSAA